MTRFVCMLKTMVTDKQNKNGLEGYSGAKDFSWSGLQENKR